jgi:hypothetical protein
LHLQEFIFLNRRVDCSTSVSLCSPHSSNPGLETFSSRTVSLRENLNLDGGPITSKSHTHPSHSQTSRLLTSFIYLGHCDGSSPPRNPVCEVCKSLWSLHSEFVRMSRGPCRSSNTM